MICIEWILVQILRCVDTQVQKLYIVQRVQLLKKSAFLFHQTGVETHQADGVVFSLNQRMFDKWGLLSTGTICHLQSHHCQISVFLKQYLSRTFTYNACTYILFSPQCSLFDNLPLPDHSMHAYKTPQSCGTTENFFYWRRQITANYYVSQY